MTKHVKVIFDRRKKAATTGTGFIDICVYLKAGERKFEIVGSATPENWEVAAQDKSILTKIKHYEQIISAMKTLGEDLTISNFNNHLMLKALEETKKNREGMIDCRLGLVPEKLKVTLPPTERFIT